MRREDKYIFGTATLVGTAAFALDLWLQHEELKKKGSRLTWETYNGFRSLKWSAVGAVSGGIIGNALFKAKFQEECEESFSSDNYIKTLLRKESVKSNPAKYKAVKEMKDEVKATLYREFGEDLVTFPEDVGSLKKRTALGPDYDGDIVLSARKNSFDTLSDMSATMHKKIEYLFNDMAIVTKKRKVSNILFHDLPEPVSIDILYGREIGNYKEDSMLNLYVRPDYFWQDGKNFKTNIETQKNILVNKPKAREVVKAFKLYFKKNGVVVENVLIDQLVLEAMSIKKYGTDYSVTENLLNCMHYISRKLNNTVIKDYANSNNNLLAKMDSNAKLAISDLLKSDLRRIELNHHYIREAFHQ